MKTLVAAETELDLIYETYKKQPTKKAFSDLIAALGLYKAKFETKKEDKEIWLRQ